MGMSFNKNKERKKKEIIESSFFLPLRSFSIPLNIVFHIPRENDVTYPSLPILICFQPSIKIKGVHDL